jgi:hypothetical protein
MTVHNDTTINLNLSQPFGHEGYTLADVKAGNKKAQQSLADLHTDLLHTDFTGATEDDVQSFENLMARLGIESGTDEEGKPRGSRGAKSWLQAIAKVLGAAMDRKADELQTAADAITGGNDDPSKMTNFQVLSSEFSLLSNTVVGALKSIGEGISAPAQASTR